MQRALRNLTRQIVTAGIILGAMSAFPVSPAHSEETVTPVPATYKELIQGMGLVNKGDYKAALPVLKAAYQKNQMPMECSYNIGVCYWQMGNIEQAVQYFDFVCKNWPKGEAAKHAEENLKKISPLGTAKLSAVDGPTMNNPAWAKFHVNQYGHMIVNAQMNGVPVRMLFDTGCEVTMATVSQLEEFGVKYKTGATKMRVQGVGGESETRVALVNLTVGGLTRPVHVLVQDDSVIKGNQGAAAALDVPLLGENFFSDLTIEVDGPRERIGFSMPEGKRPERSLGSVPFSRQGLNIMIRPKIMGRECDMILDTGASSLAFTDRQYSGLGFSRPTSADSSASLGVGGFREGYRFFIDTVELGPIKKRGVHASLSLNSNFPAPLFGVSFLGGAHFLVEPKLKQIFFLE